MSFIDSVNRFRSLSIKTDDFVLEIGSGNDPYWRSDLLLDKYVVDSTERPGGYTPLVIDRPFVVGDAFRLPFNDKGVDFLIARNILEHMVDAEQFFAEMVRVSQKGYITVPSILSEKLFGWSKHVWFISVENGVLKLQAKEKTLYDPQLSQLFHGLHRKSRSFRRFYQENRHLFVVEFYWENSIKYHIEAGPHALEGIKTAQSLFDLESTVKALQESVSPGLSQQAKSHIRRFVSNSKINSVTDIIDRLACPICYGSLSHHTEASLLCNNCDAHYPVVNNIPVLLSEVVTASQVNST